MEPTPPVPIPVEGDVQVFLDPECTQYATGTVDTVYVRINVPWNGLDEGWSIRGGQGFGGYFSAYGPSTESPDDPIEYDLWVDFRPSEYGPYTEGQVIATVFSDPVDITGFSTIFSKP